MSGALRRGWIQQEVRFGALSHTVVAPFVRNCLVTREFALLGSFLRRRASALSWLFERARLEPSYADMADKEHSNYSFQEKMAEELMGALLQTVSPSMGERSNVSQAIDSWVLSNLGEFSPAANEEFQRLIAHLDPGKLGAEKAAAAREHAARVAIDAALHALRAALPTVPRCLADLNQMLCAPQTFSPTDLFCAVQLIRSFCESELTTESDAYVAMIQCAATLAGLKWAASDAVDTFENAAVLRLCWATLIQHIASKQGYRGRMFCFRMQRSDPQCWTAGLGALSSLYAKLASLAAVNRARDDSFTIRIDGCGPVAVCVVFELLCARVNAIYILRAKGSKHPDLILTRGLSTPVVADRDLNRGAGTGGLGLQPNMGLGDIPEESTFASNTPHPHASHNDIVALLIGAATQ